jgi:hypothetical protein
MHDWRFAEQFFKSVDTYIKCVHNNIIRSGSQPDRRRQKKMTYKIIATDNNTGETLYLGGNDLREEALASVWESKIEAQEAASAIAERYPQYTVTIQ